MRIILTLLALSVLLNINLNAQNGQSEHYHDFDFWVGDWTVYKYGTDTIVGYNTIKPAHGHKVITESYHTPGGYEGSSTNIYDATTGQWEQLWVDISGYKLHIIGGLQDGKMVLSDCHKQAQCNKILWTPHSSDGSVRQEWLTSTDKGENWTKIFDGHYRKSTGSNAKAELNLLADLPNVRDFTISPDGMEGYTTVQSPLEDIRVIVKLGKSNNEWTSKRVAPLSGKYKDIEPYFAPDGLRLYFSSNRPLTDTDESNDYNIWYVERASTEDRWSAPIALDSGVNTDSDEFYPAVATSGNIYFTSVRDGAKTDDIYVAQVKDNGMYNEAAKLSTAINTDGYEFNSFIAPDESYILFSGYNRADGLGSGDLYISYRNKDNTWTTAKNMGESVNTKYMEYCPYVGRDGRLYFTSRRMDDTTQEIKTMTGLKNVISRYANGASRIYSVPMPSDLNSAESH